MYSGSLPGPQAHSGIPGDINHLYGVFTYI